MNETINYYNNNAETYYESTIDVDFAALRDSFASYLPEKARIIDVGCGSGRDVKAFCDMGYDAVGLDASYELAKLAREKLGVEVIVEDLAEWVAEEPFDGIWCCASLLHLTEQEEGAFFANLSRNLKSGGIIFISVKEGIETGLDERGRYMRNYTEEELIDKLTANGMEVLEMEYAEDGLGREWFRWINVISRRVI